MEHGLVDAPLEPPLVKLDEAPLRFCEAVVESASSSHLCKIGFNLHMFLKDKFNASNLRLIWSYILLVHLF